MKVRSRKSQNRRLPRKMYLRVKERGKKMRITKTREDRWRRILPLQKRGKTVLARNQIIMKRQK